MIYTWSLIEGFKITLGCFPIQASMLVMLAMLIDPEVNPNIFWVLITSHTLNGFLVIVNMVRSTHRIYMALQCLNVVCMFLQNFVVIYSVTTLLEMDEESDLTVEARKLHEWLRIEICIFISYISSSILFLLIRSFLRH